MRMTEMTVFIPSVASSHPWASHCFRDSSMGSNLNAVLFSAAIVDSVVK
ncbi:Uncharacterised protein [Mycobacteroides abscessus subsp. abscessus]|nr:Uncharacterised protein [Mycobacteroides abscessus subsp. abscessus]